MVLALLGAEAGARVFVGLCFASLVLLAAALRELADWLDWTGGDLQVV